MRSKFSVVLVGFGAVGQLIAKLLLERENLSLVGVVDINPDLKNRRLDEILGLPNGSGIIIKPNLKEILLENQVDVVIIVTTSYLEKVAPLIKIAVESGSNVISICEELSYPFHSFPEISAEIDELAKEKNVSVVGTGINPGYLMDLLPIVLTAPCQTVQKISIIRMMNSAERRKPFQDKIGTGLSTVKFQQKIRDKEITGHVGLIQSIQMIMAALGLTSKEIVEFPPEPIFAQEEITTLYHSIPRNSVCGLQSKAIARIEGKDLLVLNFVAFAGKHEEFDSITIEGTPRISQKIEGGVHGDLGTVAMVVNLIPKIYHANPGLLTMIDLPVPCNTAGIWKDTD